MYGANLTELVRRAQLATRPAAPSEQSRVGRITMRSPRVPTDIRELAADGDDRFEVQLERRRQQNRSLPLGDPARNSMYDDPCDVCHEVECLCEAPS